MVTRLPREKALRKQSVHNTSRDREGAEEYKGAFLLKCGVLLLRSLTVAALYFEHQTCRAKCAISGCATRRYSASDIVTLSLCVPA